MSAVAFINDSRLVSASYDKTLRVWDLTTGFVADTLQVQCACMFGSAPTPAPSPLQHLLSTLPPVRATTTGSAIWR